MKILMLLSIPYLPLAAGVAPAGGPVQVSDDSSSTRGRVSSPGPVGDDAPGGPSAVFTPSAVRERSRGWEIKRLEGCGWRLLMSARCAVRADVPADDLRAAGVHADAFIEAVERTLKGDSSGLRFSLRVFRDRDSFNVYASLAGAKGAESFYDPRMAEAVLWWPEKGKDRPWRLLMHEMTHAYFDRVFNRREPLWLAEGFAEYFAAYRVEKGAAIVPGGANAAASARLRAALEDKSFVPLRKLLAAGRDAFYGAAHALHYAEAGSLMTFLAERQDEDRPLVLWELARGKGLHLVWDLRELEKQWIDSIRETK